MAAHRPGAGPDETVVRLLLDRLRARAASGDDGVEREVPRQVRPGLGHATRGDLRTTEAAGRDSARRGAHTKTRGVPGVGLALGEREAALRPADGGLRRLSGERRLERRAAARRGRGDGRARQHARDLHLRRQRREHGGHDHRLVQRADDAERDRADARAAAIADRRIRRARCLGHRRVRAALRQRLGVGGQRALPVGQAGRLAPGRHPQRHGHLLAPADHRRRRVAFPVHPLHRHRPDDPRSGRHP